MVKRHMMKKYVHVFLAIFIGLYILFFPVHADESAVYIETSDTTVKRGDTFTVTVYSTAISGVVGIEVKVDFDTAVFQLTNISSNRSLPLAMQSTVNEANENGMAGSIYLDMGGLNGLTVPDNTAYLQLTMQAKNDAKLGSSSIQLEKFSAYSDTEKVPVLISVSSVSVQVSDSATIANTEVNKNSSLDLGGVAETNVPESPSVETASAASTSAAGENVRRITFCDCEGKPLTVVSAQPGQYVQGPVEYQYDDSSAIAGDLTLKPLNCLVDGYVVVNTYSSGQN